MKRIAAESQTLDKAIDSLPSARAYARTLIRRLQTFYDLRPGCRVLEIGSGCGALLAAFAEMGYDCAGVEPSAQARSTSRTLFARCRVSPRLISAKAEHIPIEESTFDLVIANSVLEHVNDAERAIQEAFRVLSDGEACFGSRRPVQCLLSRARYRGSPSSGGTRCE